MNKITWILALITLCVCASCSDKGYEPDSLITKNTVVDFGRAAASGAVNNESKIGDIHVVNYFNGVRIKSVHLNDYYLNNKPINIESAVGQSSVLYVVANINPYAGKLLTNGDFPMREADLEAWTFALNSSQIETHKSNITDALFVMSGRSAQGEITDSEQTIEITIPLERQFAKVDIKIWYDPSAMTKLDMTDAKVYFKQFVHGVAPLAAGNGMSYTADGDPSGEPIYTGAFTSIEGVATADKSQIYCYPRNYMPSNDASKKLMSTHLVVEAKWDGTTKYWIAPVSNNLPTAPFRLVGNTHLSLTGKLVSEGEERPEITEKMMIELQLTVVDWHPYSLDDNEIGN